MTMLQQLTLAAAARAAADAEVRALVFLAVAEGIPVQHVAQAAGVTRATVYKWTKP